MLSDQQHLAVGQFSGILGGILHSSVVARLCAGIQRWEAVPAPGSEALAWLGLAQAALLQLLPVTLKRLLTPDVNVFWF